MSAGLDWVRGSFSPYGKQPLPTSHQDFRSGTCTCARLGIQSLLDGGFHLGFSLDSQNLVDDFAVSSNEETLGQRRNSAVSLAHGLFPEQYRVIHAHVSGEPRDLVFPGVIHGDPDNLQALRSILILKINQPRRLNLAGSTPGRPEVDQNGFTFEPGEADCFAIESFER